jgi:hypothetical protein
VSGQVRNLARAWRNALIAPLRRSQVSLDRPVFIWGNGQSGTFILYDLLAASGAFAFPATRGPRKKGLATQRYKAHDIVLDLKPIEGQLLCWSNVGLPFQRSDGWIFDQELAAEQAAKVDIQEVRARYRRLCESWIWDAGPTRRLLDKSTNYLFMLAAIDRVFPDAQHIFVVRDPRLVLSSILHRFKDLSYEENFQGFASGFYGDILLPGWQAKRNASIDLRNAWQVEECIRIGLRWADRLGERCTTVHHEALCANPIDVMHRLMDRLDLTYPEGQLERLVTGVATVVEKRWPIGSEDCDTAAGLFFDHGSAADMTSLNRLAVELGYDGHICGRRPSSALCSCEMK